MVELVFVLKQQLVFFTALVATSFIGLKFNASVYAPFFQYATFLSTFANFFMIKNTFTNVF